MVGRLYSFRKEHIRHLSMGVRAPSCCYFCSIQSWLLLKAEMLKLPVKHFRIAIV